MRVTISLGEPASRVLGQKQVTVALEETSATVAAAWAALLDAYPALQKSFARGDLAMALFLNGELVPRERRASTIVHDGDRLQVVFPVGGG